MRLDRPPARSDAWRMGPSLAHRVRVEAHAVWLAVRDPRTPWPARIVGLLVAAYALSPLDLIPDFIPVLGLVDDMVLIPAGIWLFERLIPRGRMAEHRAAAEAASERPVSIPGVLIVVAVWALAAWLVWGWIATWWD
ncbi:YkvA family protein [Stakelama saccharophila]|uniref:YkvA family protein n=1 Tax=Stakelama saccharophila TaxID=3075605 RepID=A0ABZ0B7E8_9SPHN|nr:YkvA family protein [Stakelama sp. W311]WNO53308.1 YkvA family protein [Stakelama sp. W311]